MITIFHGDNPSESRTKYLEHINQFTNYELLHLDPKTIDLNQINNFINGGSLLPGNKALAIDNFFSIPKATLDKLLKIIKNTDTEITIWQDKLLLATQKNTFPKAKVYTFAADKIIQNCLNSIKPHNIKIFTNQYKQIISNDMYDLFLWYLKSYFRRRLQGNTIFNQIAVKKIYLQLIELEFQYKSGQLTFPKDIALLRVLLPLVK